MYTREELKWKSPKTMITSPGSWKSTSSGSDEEEEAEPEAETEAEADEDAENWMSRKKVAR